MNEVSKDAHDKFLEFNLGDTLMIKLKSNATTGYEWHFTERDEEAIELLKDDFQTSSNLDGASSARIITLKFIKQGEYHIQLKYYRIWEGADESVDDFQLSFSVKE